MKKKLIAREFNFTLFNALAILFSLMILSAIALWLVALNLVNTTSNSLSAVTFSSVLGTEEDLRILYAAWLALYLCVSIFLLMLVVLQPVHMPHLHKINVHIAIKVLNFFYFGFVVAKLYGLLGVLLEPITDPDPEVERLHYIFASVAFGSAIAISWVLFFKRLIYKEDIMRDHSYLLTILNFCYCAIVTSVSIWFIVTSFEEDYFQEKGYVELALTMFCVFDRLWQLADYYDDSMYIVVVKGN